MANKYFEKWIFATDSLLNGVSVLFLSFSFYFIKHFGVELFVFEKILGFN